MRLRFFIDPFLDAPHFTKHGVSQREIVEFFHEIAYFEKRRRDGSFVAYGKLSSGRVLKTVYRKLTADYYFIITAYDVENRDVLDFVERNLP